MKLLTDILVLLVALEFCFIFYLESVRTSSARTASVFGMEEGELKRPSVDLLFKNQGVYNLVIALMLILELSSSTRRWSSRSFWPISLWSPPMEPSAPVPGFFPCRRVLLSSRPFTWPSGRRFERRGRKCLTTRHFLPSVLLLRGKRCLLFWGDCMGKENWYSMEFRQAKVTKIVKETSDIYSIQMEIPEGYTWRAGQYAIWQLQDYVAPEGEKEDRVFTIASAMEDHFLMFSTRIADQHSWFKDILLRQLEAGDTILVSAPLGEMDIDMEGKERSLLIAGGIGVTPIRSLMRHYSSNNVPMHKIQLLYADNRGEFAYGDFWKQIEGKMPNVKLQLLTDSNVFAEKARNYAVSHGNEAEYLIAGSPGMNQAFKESLAEAGVSGGNMKTDEFFGYE